MADEDIYKNKKLVFIMYLFILCMLLLTHSWGIVRLFLISLIFCCLKEGFCIGLMHILLCIILDLRELQNR